MNDRLFKHHDAHKLEDPQRLQWMPVAEVIRACAVQPGMRVADIGAGTGYFAIPLARAVGREGKVYAVDLQPEMLELLRQKLRQPDAPHNIELISGDASATTLPVACVNLALLANVWHEIEDHRAALQEVVRILAPGGSLAVLDWRPDTESPPGPQSSHRISAAEVVRLLQQSQWTADRPLEIGRYSYFVSARPARGI